jgi:PAS domain S-box-containing protein
MKILTWAAGALFFLGVALTTYLLIDAEGAARLIDSVIPFGTATEADTNPFARALWLIKTNFLFYGAVTLASGFLWATLAGSGRRKFVRPPRVPSADGPRHARAAAPASQPTQDFLNQLEVNWKTFASYTQDLLHRKIKELEEAPQKALKEMTGQAAALWKALEEVKRSVALGRGELKETAQVLQERIGLALGEGARKKDNAPVAGGTATEPLLRHVEKRLAESGERFGRIEERLAKLVESIEADRKRPAPAAAGPGDASSRKAHEELVAGLEAKLARLVESMEAERRRPAPASGGDASWRKAHEELVGAIDARIARLAEWIEADRRDASPAAGDFPWKKVQEELAQVLDAKLARLVESMEAERRKAAPAGGDASPHGGQGDTTASHATPGRLEERVGALCDFLEEGRKQAVERRVEKFKQETLARIAALTSEVEEGKKDRDRLRSELAHVRETESALRTDHDAALAREKEHRKLLEEAAARDEAASRKIHDLSNEGERLRKDLERTRSEAAARAQSLTADLEKARKEIESLRGELDRTREAEAGVRAELAKSVGREKEHVKRLEECAVREEKDSRRIKDLASETDRLRKDCERRQKGFEEERARLSAEITELSAQGSQLESDMEDALSGTERLQGLLQSREADLAGLRASMEALRVEKERLEEDVKRLGEDVKALRAGKLGAEKKRLKDLMDENAVLRREIDAARAALEDGRAGDGSPRDPSFEEVQSLRRELEKERSEKGSKVEELEAEAKRLRSELGDVDGKWMARVAELEARLSDAEEAGQKLEVRAAEQSPPADDASALARERESALRLQQLEREKTELVASLNRLGEELQRLRADIDGFRRFHGALIQGNIPAAIVAADASLKVFAWNPAAEALWGVEANAVLGKLLPAIGVKGLDGEVIEQANLAMKERRSTTLPQSSFADRKGASRHVRWTCDPVLGPNGDSLGVVIIAEDLTAEVERQIESRLQALFSQSLLRSIPAGVVVLDPQRRVISWNRKAEIILGVPESEAIGQDFFSLRMPLAKSAFQKRFEESRKDGAIHRLRVRFEVNGVPGNHVVTQAPFYGGDDSVRGTMLLLELSAEAELAGGRSG